MLGNQKGFKNTNQQIKITHTNIYGLSGNSRSKLNYLRVLYCKFDSTFC